MGSEDFEWWGQNAWIDIWRGTVPWAARNDTCCYLVEQAMCPDATVDFPRLTEICNHIESTDEELDETVHFLFAHLRRDPKRQLKALTIINEMLYYQDVVTTISMQKEWIEQLEVIRTDTNKSVLGDEMDGFKRIFASEIKRRCWDDLYMEERDVNGPSNIAGDIAGAFFAGALGTVKTVKAIAGGSTDGGAQTLTKKLDDAKSVQDEKRTANPRQSSFRDNMEDYAAFPTRPPQHPGAASPSNTAGRRLSGIPRRNSDNTPPNQRTRRSAQPPKGDPSAATKCGSPVNINALPGRQSQGGRPTVEPLVSVQNPFTGEARPSRTSRGVMPAASRASNPPPGTSPFQMAMGAADGHAGGFGAPAEGDMPQSAGVPGAPPGTSPWGAPPPQPSQASTTPFGAPPAHSSQASSMPFGAPPAQSLQEVSTPYFGASQAQSSQASKTPFGVPPAQPSSAPPIPAGAQPGAQASQAPSPSPWGALLPSANTSQPLAQTFPPAPSEDAQSQPFGGGQPPSAFEAPHAQSSPWGQPSQAQQQKQQQQQQPSQSQNTYTPPQSYSPQPPQSFTQPPPSQPGAHEAPQTLSSSPWGALLAQPHASEAAPSQNAQAPEAQGAPNPWASASNPDDFFATRNNTSNFNQPAPWDAPGPKTLKQPEGAADSGRGSRDLSSLF